MLSLSCYRSCTSKKAKKYCTEQETESVMLSQDKGLLFEEALGMFFIGNVVLLKTISSLFCPLSPFCFIYVVLQQMLMNMNVIVHEDPFFYKHKFIVTKKDQQQNVYGYMSEYCKKIRMHYILKINCATEQI